MPSEGEPIGNQGKVKGDLWQILRRSPLRDEMRQRSRAEHESIQDMANQFPLSDEPRFHADEAWQALTRFRWHLIDHEHYEAGWLRKTIAGLQEIGKKYQLKPAKEPFDSFIVVLSQFKAKKPRKVELTSPDQPCWVVMIESGTFGETREVALHLDYLFLSDRRALIRWAEGWIRARERMILNPTPSSISEIKVAKNAHPRELNADEVPLRDDCEIVLCIMLERQSKPMSISNLITFGPLKSRATLGKAIRTLETLEFVERRYGPRGGRSLTDAGITRARAVSAKRRAQSGR